MSKLEATLRRPDGTTDRRVGAGLAPAPVSPAEATTGHGMVDTDAHRTREDEVSEYRGDNLAPPRPGSPGRRHRSADRALPRGLATVSRVTRGRVKPWSDFERSAAALAAIGRDRLATGSPNYLATIRGDGLPRVHPVSATVKGGRLAVYMYPTSPKGQDLVVDGRYALHCSVSDHDGGDGEFYVRGIGARVDQPELQRELAAAGFGQLDGYVLYELGVDEAFACSYSGESRDPLIGRWRWSEPSD